MDIDFSNPNFGSSQCPWNKKEKTTEHRCAVKDTSICKFFCGVQYLDSVLCSFPYENISVLSKKDTDDDLRK